MKYILSVLILVSSWIVYDDAALAGPDFMLPPARCTSQKTTPLSTLRKTIMCNYNKDERPVKDMSKNVTVGMDLVVQFVQYHGWDGWSKLYIHTWIHLSWFDEFLKWEPSQYSNIDTIPVRSDEIWFPEIMVFTVTDMMDATPVPVDSHCQVFSNGKVKCRPPAVLNAQCASDGHMWPFDTLNCTMEVGPSGRPQKEMDMNFLGSGVTLEQYQPHYDWKLLSVKHNRFTNIYGNNSYVWLEYNFILRREAKANVVGIVIPALIFVVLTLTSFWMEPEGIERISLCCTDIICHFLFLQYIAYIVPSTGTQSPLIVTFLRDSMILTAVSLMIAIMVQGLTMASFSPPVKVVLYSRRFLNSLVGQIIIPSDFSTNEDSKAAAEVPEDFQMHQVPEETSPQEWRLFGIILDRVFFILFFILFCIFMLKFIF